MAERVILYSTTLRRWEVWEQGRPIAHGPLAACQQAYPGAPEPSAEQHAMAARDAERLAPAR